jgi:glutamate N-acetyltransferase/amino-acid N-acetyltransferase
MIATTDGSPVTAAGVFTTNLVAAAPVQISRQHLRDGRAAAVVLNSGNANAATGEPGRADARRMCELTAKARGCATSEVLVCQTGLIGIPMLMDPIETGVPKLAAQLSTDDAGAIAAADAILTTDSVRKLTRQPVELRMARAATIGGMAKGAAMLAPAMATMLAVLTTDVAIEPGPLHSALQAAVDESFNALVVDACRSTNDTVLVLANGAAGNEPISESRGFAYAAFVESLTEACTDLARQMAHDAEGATKCVTLQVQGARTRAEAQRAARAVASSQLVQCSLYGKDPYWGRIISELGASGAEFDPEQVEITYFSRPGGTVTPCRDGVACEHDAAILTRIMNQREIGILCDLGAGHGQARMWFTDLTHAYVDENSQTS